MADEPKQFYLVTVQRMVTSDEADLVAGWSAVVAEEDLKNLDLNLAAQAAELSLRDCPIMKLRPMTEAEIEEWRHAERGS